MSFRLPPPEVLIPSQWPWNEPTLWYVEPLFFLVYVLDTNQALFCFKVKPDGVQRGLVGNIIARFETKGYTLVAMKTRMATKEILDEHYKDLVDKPFFPALRDYLLSGPVVSMCWAGKEAGTMVESCFLVSLYFDHIFPTFAML